LEDLRVDGRMIVKADIEEIRLKSLDWINLTQDRDQWPALVNRVINNRVP
jgi:hypothetical protein